MVLSPNLITLQEVGVWEKSGRSMEDPKNAFDPSKNVLVFIPYVGSPAEGALIPFRLPPQTNLNKWPGNSVHLIVSYWSFIILTGN